MASEIELKFLTTTDGWKQYAGKPKEIKQYYLPSETTLTLNGDNVTITAPSCAPVVIPVSDLPPNSKNESLVDAFEALDTTITVGGKTELRVRSKNEEPTITLKRDTKDSNTRNEFESSLTNVDAFNTLSEQSQGRMVGKKRYKLDKKALCDAGIISQEMYDAVGEIIVDEYDEDHHAYLRDKGVLKYTVSEIEFKEGTSEGDLERFKTEFSQNAGFATPITDEQKIALKNKNIAAYAAAAAAVAEVAGILGGEATQG
jgi:CYTH domain-containing protein